MLHHLDQRDRMMTAHPAVLIYAFLVKRYPENGSQFSDGGSRLYSFRYLVSWTLRPPQSCCAFPIPLNCRMAVPIVSPHPKKLRLGAARFHTWTVCHRYHSGGRVTCGPLGPPILVGQAWPCASHQKGQTEIGTTPRDKVSGETRRNL